MIALGVSRLLAAAAAGVAVSTLRRWFVRERSGQPLRRQRGPALTPPPEPRACLLVAGLVRDLHGLAGAATLAKSVPGVSRRQAAAIKHETITQMERDRVSSCKHLVPVAAGVMRGFDQLYLTTSAGPWYALISSDTAVPFRTGVLLTPRYNAPSVALAVERDFALHGAPLVWRADRAKAHDTRQVREILDHYKVQEESAQSYHIAGTHVQQAKASNFTSHYIGLGGALVRNEVHVRFDGEGAEATVNGLYMASGTQHMDNFTVIDHAKPHCASHELYKGILDGFFPN